MLSKKSLNIQHDTIGNEPQKGVAPLPNSGLVERSRETLAASKQPRKRCNLSIHHVDEGVDATGERVGRRVEGVLGYLLEH